MALPDTCPKCGEKATNDNGQCVFCGTQVTRIETLATPDQEAQFTAKYRFASWSFIGVGIVYLLVGVIGSIAYHRVLFGFILSGAIATVHGSLLVAKQDVVQSITKTACLIRIALQVWTLLVLLPYMLVLIVPGSLLLLLFSFDITCLFIMYGVIDDVYFN